MTDEKILIDDFIKLDLRIGRVLDAKEVEDSRKMLELTVDIGVEHRKIFAGIKKRIQVRMWLVLCLFCSIVISVIQTFFQGWNDVFFSKRNLAFLNLIFSFPSCCIYSRVQEIAQNICF